MNSHQKIKEIPFYLLAVLLLHTTAFAAAEPTEYLVTPMNFSIVHGMGLAEARAAEQNKLSASNFSLGLLGTQVDSSSGVMVSSLLNTTHKPSEGLFVAGLVNWSKDDVMGVSFAGIGNYTKGNHSLVQMAGIFNHVKGDFEGYQASGIISSADNVMGVQSGGLINKSTTLLGYQHAGILNRTGTMVGGQAAGIINISKETRGIQAAGIVNSSKNILGLQMAGIVNRAGHFQGAQIAGIVNKGDIVLENSLQLSGIVNLAKTVSENSVQFGLINISEKNHGVAIGAVSICKNYNVGLSIDLDEYLFTNFTLRSGNHNLQNLLLVGFQPDGDYMTWGMGFAKRFYPSQKISISPELLYQVITNYEEESEGGFATTETNVEVDDDHLYQQLKLKVLGDYKIYDRIYLYAGPSVALLVGEKEHTPDFVTNDIHDGISGGDQGFLTIGGSAGIRFQ